MASLDDDWISSFDTLALFSSPQTISHSEIGMILFFAMFCYALSQSCGDANVVCVGPLEDFKNLTAGINAVTPGSGIQYILLTNDEPSSEILINEAHAAGTAGNYITIMPDPALGDVEVVIDFDGYVDGEKYHWLVIERPFWRLSGGEFKNLKFLKTRGGTQKWLGFVTIASGNVMIDNNKFDCGSFADYTNFIGIWCDDSSNEGLCDDDSFDGIIIDGVEFTTDYSGYGTAIKGNIDAASWETVKLEVMNCDFFVTGLDIYSFFRVPNYGPDLDGNVAYRRGGLQNVLIHDNNFGDSGAGFHFDQGKDIFIYDNEITYTTAGGYVIAPYPMGSSLSSNGSLDGFYFYDNTVTYTDGSTDYGQAFLYISDYDTGESHQWITNMVIRNNVITNLGNPLMYVDSLPGVDVTFEGNTITTYSDFAHPGAAGDCFIEFYESDTVMGDKELKMYNNHITWNLADITVNNSWICSKSALVDVTLAYNYFALSDASDFAVHMFYGQNTTHVHAYGDIKMYGNVVYHEKDGHDFCINSDMDLDFMVTCKTMEITNNLFSTNFYFPTGEGLTIEDNEVSEDESAYDEADPCATDYVVPYDSELTPAKDINEKARAVSGNTWIGPETCYVKPIVDPVVDYGSADPVAVLFSLVVVMLLM